MLNKPLDPESLPARDVTRPRAQSKRGQGVTRPASPTPTPSASPAASEPAPSTALVVSGETGSVRVNRHANARAIMTARRQLAFLREFARHGYVLGGARAAGISSDAVYKWRKRDPAFAALCDSAEHEAKDAIRLEVYRRAVEGWDEPVYQGGKQVGVIHKHSDRLLELLVKSKDESFKERTVHHQHSGANGGPIVVTNVIEGYSDAELEEVNRMLESRGIKVRPDVIDVPAVVK
jgi:hypothetical protein